MESDLSLIEIAGEDDSLLLEVEDTSTNCFFSCSPLQIPGSNRPSPTSTIVGLRHNANVEKPTCSSPNGSRNKENVNVNKSEVPKLSVDPQQMKRRKRGGACSLRKSLAWDKAFFTEEGVLNPLELSMLSGRFGNSSGEVLPTIQEDGIKLSSSNSSTSDSADLQGTPKILSNQRGNRTGSKSGGCPRPLVFSSLKRPANASTTKAAMKESKLPKIPVSRSCVHSLPKSNKSNVLSTSHLKDNQIGQADTVQKSARLQGSFKTTKSTTNKAKAGSDSLSLSAKSSLRQPRRNMANSVLEVHPLTNPQTPLVMKAKRGLEAFPATVLPPTGSRAPDVYDLSGKTGVLLTQNSRCVSGNLPYTQFQTTKPSGLRMPSPSLGFFGQTKYSASNSSTQKATHKVCQSSFKGYSGIRMNENNCILQSGSSNQLKKDGNYGMTIACPEFRDSNMNDLETTNFASQHSREIDKWNLKKAEQTNAFAHEPDQIPQGENHNLIRNYGFSLEDRKALESQNYKGENVANVNSNIRLSDGSEKLSCNSPPHESREKAKEGAAGVDQLRERLGKDVQAHFLDETLLVKNYDNKLHTSKVNEKFEEDLKLQSCCLLDEPNVITQDPGVVQADGADTYDMIEELQVKASNSADIVPPVENRMTGAVTSCNFMAFCSPSKEEDIRSLEANGLKNNILVEKAESKVSLDNPHDENERIKINGDTLSEKRRFSDEFDAGDLVNTVDVHIINQGSSGSELKICQIASLLESTGQANKDTARTDMMTNVLFVGDANVQSLNGNLLFENSNCGQIHSVMDGQCLMVVTDVNGQAGGEPELQTHSLEFDHIVQDNHGLNFNDNLLHGKSTDYEEPREEKVLANVPIVQEHSDVDGSEINSSSVVIQVPMPLSMQDSVDDVEGIPEHQLAEYAPSDSVIIGTSAEHDKYSIDIHHGNDMGFSAQAMSSEFVVTNEELFSIEESGLAVHKIQILANEVNAVAEVDKMNIILPDDIEVGRYQKNVSPTGDLQHRMDHAICHTEKEDTTMLINKSEDGGKQNNLMIKPPVNAVPFSDEWLAAIESAGEEILTMKSGAVQNSPTDKSLPEPGPWSPVKRKQGQIGPFDCTKFINIAPPDSD